MTVKLPEGFEDLLKIENAQTRFQEAREIADKLLAANIPLLPQMDHAAIFTDPPYLVAGPLKRAGYIAGWDTRCYPSPVDGHDYINVPSGLPDDHPNLKKGWFRYVAVVYPVDSSARDQMLSQGYGNPFIHHLTWGIAAPKFDAPDAFQRAKILIPYMKDIRAQIGNALQSTPGTLIMALPDEAVNHPDFDGFIRHALHDIKESEYKIETMQGGGFLIQFFVLTGGRIEVALRIDTQQTFNPKSVHKISEDEISTNQTDS